MNLSTASCLASAELWLPERWNGKLLAIGNHGFAGEFIEAAARFHDEDPFTRAQLFERADVVRWDRHIGNPEQATYTP
jgi:hypothetical protein